MIVKKGDVLKLKVDKFAFVGRGIAKVDKDALKTGEVVQDNENSKYVIFIDSAYPGDVVAAKLKKFKETFAEAKTVTLIEESPDRVEAPCKYFGVCGGCKQQDLVYEKQIEYKQKQVKEIFKKMGGYEEINVEPIIPSEKVFYYRNKMEFSFGDKKWLMDKEISSDEKFERDFALGLFIPKRYDRILDIDECFLQSETSNNIINFTRTFFMSRGIVPYTTRTHSGFLRNLIIRQAENTNDLMVNLVTYREYESLVSEYAKRLVETVPEVTTVVNNVNRRRASVSVGDYEKIILGTGYIYDMIGKYKFRISANSFFQTNTLQTENLYNLIIEYAELEGEEIVYDLYSGAGTISIYISSYAKKVIGFESVKPAIDDARVNKANNNIKNVEFHLADLNNSLLAVHEEEQLPKPDVIVIDPPRAGMHKNTVEDIMELDPKRIVYVSCNPTTQVRDIKILTDNGYKLEKMRPVDMFPHTYHIENVAKLVKA